MDEKLVEIAGKTGSTISKMGSSHYIINNELEIHPKALDQLEDAEVEELFELTKNLQLLSPGGKLDKKLSSSLIKFRRKYRLCFITESNEAMRGFLQALKLVSNTSIFQNPTLHEYNEIIAIMKEYKKRTSFLLIAGQFAILNCPTNISEFLPYLKFAMLQFKSMNWVLPDDLIGYELLYYLEDKFNEYSILVPESGAIRTEGDLADIAFVKALAKECHISFKSIPEAVCHIFKHGDLNRNEYLSDAICVISNGICVSSNVTQDGTGRRFVFEYEYGETQHHAIVLEINGQVFLATYFF